MEDEFKINLTSYKEELKSARRDYRQLMLELATFDKQIKQLISKLEMQEITIKNLQAKVNCK